MVVTVMHRAAASLRLPRSLRLPPFLRLPRFLLLAACLAVAAASFQPSAVRANPNWYSDLDHEVRAAIQDVLIWSGDYKGMLDGIIGPQTRRAVAAYQRRIGTQSDGLLTAAEFERLMEERDVLQRRSEWTIGHDETGLGFGLPYAHARFHEQREQGLFYRSERGDFRVRTFRILDFPPEEAQVFARGINEGVPGFRETYLRASRDWVVLAGEDAGELFYMRALLREREVRGFFVWYAKEGRETYDRLAVAMANSLIWRRVEEVPPSPGEAASGEVSRTMPPRDEPRPRNEAGSGSAFAVHSSGLLVTNAHVVEGCGRVAVRGRGDAQVVASDRMLDLAVLRVAPLDGAPVARLADDEPRLAEPVYAFGFPLPGTLGDGLGFSAGNVSALVGLDSNPDQFRMTAAVQPGNSGGPLIDTSGRVVGVVTSKLNAVRIADTTGDIPQSMNFAVRTSVLRRFLDRAGLKADFGARATAQGVTDIAAAAQGYTHQVLCYAR